MKNEFITQITILNLLLHNISTISANNNRIVCKKMIIIMKILYNDKIPIIQSDGPIMT